MKELINYTHTIRDLNNIRIINIGKTDTIREITIIDNDKNQLAKGQLLANIILIQPVLKSHKLLIDGK